MKNAVRVLFIIVSLLIGFFVFSKSALAEQPSPPPQQVQQPEPQPPLPAAQPYSPLPNDSPPPHNKLFGMGLKLGDGIGFGLDFLFHVSHFNLDLMFAGSSSNVGMTAYGAPIEVDVLGFAPELQLLLFSGPRSTPYLAAGLQYATAAATNSNASATASGYIANIGYIWHWPSGFQIELGLGIQHLNKLNFVDSSNPCNNFSKPGNSNLNLEFALQYMIR